MSKLFIRFFLDINSFFLYNKEHGVISKNNIEGENMESLIRPNSSWKNLDTHYIDAISNEWYKCLIDLQNLIFKYTFMFYEEKNI